ncbi:hypothetical protein MHYP_G00131180 [Metynnis hypsauchen]
MKREQSAASVQLAGRTLLRWDRTENSEIQEGQWWKNGAQSSGMGPRETPAIQAPRGPGPAVFRHELRGTLRPHVPHAPLCTVALLSR